MLTMIIGGLWHGANWTFVIWGIYHGALLAINRSMKDSTFELPVLVQRAWTFFLVLIGWVFFRAVDLTMATQILKKMFGFVVRRRCPDDARRIGADCVPGDRGSGRAFRKEYV